ncbi:helix-turn-helix transcriptional regulator, partial [Nocardia sp. NPDC004722]
EQRGFTVTDIDTATGWRARGRYPAQPALKDLGVSINTVKTHMRGIYGKLGTSSRTDALDRARRTGLL